MVGEEPLGSGRHPGLSATLSWSVQAVLLHLGQGEGLSVQGHPHHQLLLRGPGLDPVVHGEVLKREVSGLIDTGDQELTALK